MMGQRFCIGRAIWTDWIRANDWGKKMYDGGGDIGSWRHPAGKLYCCLSDEADQADQISAFSTNRAPPALLSLPFLSIEECMRLPVETSVGYLLQPLSSNDHRPTPFSLFPLPFPFHFSF